MKTLSDIKSITLSIFRSEDNFDDQRSSIGSPSSTTTKEDKDVTPDESMEAPHTIGSRYCRFFLSKIAL